MSGQLRIVPSCALGSLGPSEGEPVLYTWRWYYSATGMGLWIVLILAMILPKANRTPKTLLILVPLAAVSLGWIVVRTQLGGNLPDNVAFGIMIYTLAVGSAVLWLLAHRIAARVWYKTLLAAMGIALGVALVGSLSMGVQSAELIVVMIFVGVLMLGTVTGYALGARGYGARRAWRFFVLQIVGTVGVSFAGMFIGVMIQLIASGGFDGMGKFFIFILVAGLIAGIIVFLIALPFTILGLSSPFFRQRLLMCAPQRPAPSCDDRGISASAIAETPT